MVKLTPKIDIAFKRIFGVEENKDLLISFVNAVVSAEDQVTDLTLLNPYNPQQFAEQKLSILDIKAKGQHGQRVNIEIQVANEGDYDKRALFYWAKMYTEQLLSGQDYRQLSKAIGIHVLNFDSITGDNNYHHCFRITDEKTRKRFFKDLELHTIELHKFESDIEQLQDLVAKVQSALDVWLAFLTRHDLINRDTLPPALDHVELKKALGVLDIMNLTEQEQYAYEAREKWLRIEANTLHKAKEEGREEGLEEGRKEGREEGREEGLEEGMAMGEVKGRKEGREEGLEEGMAMGEVKGRKAAQEAFAINLLKQQLDHAVIAECTGLSIEAILALEVCQ